MIDLILWLPDFIPALVLVLGLVAVVLGWFGAKLLPTVISQYLSLVKVLGVLALVFGVYGFGVNTMDQRTRAELADARVQIAAAEALASQVNTQVITEFVDRVKIVQGKSVERIKYVDRYITKEDDSMCAIGERFGVLHDSAANNTVPSTTDLDRAAEQDTKTPSTIKLSDVSKTIDSNYAEFYKMQEEVNLWRKWYREQKQIFDNLNKENKQ